MAGVKCYWRIRRAGGELASGGSAMGWNRSWSAIRTRCGVLDCWAGMMRVGLCSVVFKKFCPGGPRTRFCLILGRILV